MEVDNKQNIIVNQQCFIPYLDFRYSADEGLSTLNETSINLIGSFHIGLPILTL